MDKIAFLKLDLAYNQAAVATMTYKIDVNVLCNIIKRVSRDTRQQLQKGKIYWPRPNFLPCCVGAHCFTPGQRNGRFMLIFSIFFQGFLVEAKLNRLLAPLEKDEQSLMRLDAIFAVSMCVFQHSLWRT